MYEQESVVAILNTRGIALLHSSNQLEVYSWREISSFGTKTHKLSNDTFAFALAAPPGEEKKEPHVVALVTPHAVNMHKMAVELSNQAAAGGAQTQFPAKYNPVEASK